MVGGVAIVTVVVMIAFMVLSSVVVFSLIHVCGPDEVLVISGEANMRGISLVTQGRVVRVPLLQLINHMDVTPVAIAQRFAQVGDREGGYHTIEIEAEVVFSRDELSLERAASWALRAPRPEVEAVVALCVEGALRHVAVTLRGEELRRDRARLAQVLGDELELELRPLGLEVKSLEIEDVR